VHYPVKGGKVINIVVITADDWNAEGWSEPASRIDLLPRLTAARWAPQARALVRLPEAWLKWPLFERRSLATFAQDAAALLVDAAHPMLPFLAQGGAMAIEDAVVAAECLARWPNDAATALQTYSAIRRGRTRRVQRQAARNGQHYHLKGVSAMLRNTAMGVMGGTHLLGHYDWLFDWRPPAALSMT
jgi:salicylate hydroxylase